MNKRAILTVALALVFGLPAAGLAQDTRPGIAVIPFVNGGSIGAEPDDFAAFELGLQELLITELAMNSSLRVVERGRIKDLMAEQDLGASGRVDASTAAQIGKLVGAKYTIMGGFIEVNNSLTLTARVVDGETAEIVKADRVRGGRDDIYAMSVDLADQLTRGLNLPALERQALNERREREIPGDAVRLYTKALLYQERGQTDRAVELFRQVVTEFPQYTEARDALQQIGRG
ncbi:MAG TPA: CsgG/HfaB family protein [Gemmatimonadales bacterium]